MHSSIFVAIAAFAAAAIATPMEEKRNYAPPPISCAAPYTPKCCQSVSNNLLNLIEIPVGIACSVLGTSCNEVTACCASGSQFGLVNVGNVCPIIVV
ncbi:hypothetical protein MMC25_007216 [Agyrium rufum]|nr:hypothetical protein [Agyrium rufum]